MLTQLHENRIAHAQLFFGKAGYGTLAIALQYLQQIFCLNLQENGACGTCSACQKTQKFIHPDIHFSFPVNKTKEIKKDKLSSHDFLHLWREQLATSYYFSIEEFYNHLGLENAQGIINSNESEDIIHQLSLKPYEANCKAVLMWCPEKMNQAAANKLLKLIEEPPQKTIFILVSEFPEQILGTILSRTQLVKILPIANEDLIEKLIKEGFENEKTQEAVHMADGCYISARNYLLQNEQQNFNFEAFTQQMRYSFMAKKKIDDLLTWAENIAGIGREKQKSYLQYALKILREAFIKPYVVSNELLKANQEERIFLSKFSAYIHVNNIEAIVKLFEDAHYHIDRNANPKILFTDLSLQMTKLLWQKQAT